MRQSCFCLCSALLLLLPSALSAGTFPRLLPPAEEFRLTLREDRDSFLPLGQSCEGEAALTLECRAFTLVLQNLSKHTVHISGLTCAEPRIVVFRKEGNATSGWWPVSQGIDTCKHPLPWTNTRIRPGETVQYSTRLASPRRDTEEFFPGTYTLRAEWRLEGCTDSAQNDNCLTPMQVVHPPGSVADVSMQEAVRVLSNEITVESPQLPDLGNIGLSLEVKIDSSTPANNCSDHDASVACTVFHAQIRNVGSRPVRWFTFSCSDSGIIPEYRTTDTQWKVVPSKHWICTRNVRFSVPILPGEITERTFTLGTLQPGYDTTALPLSPLYQFRFALSVSNFCLASPDGKFCLAQPKQQASAFSQEISFQLK